MLYLVFIGAASQGNKAPGTVMNGCGLCLGPGSLLSCWMDGVPAISKLSHEYQSAYAACVRGCKNHAAPALAELTS